MMEELEWLCTVLPSPRNAYGAEWVEMQQVDDAGAAARFALKPVFCHNDLVSGNVLVDTAATPPRCQLIDFEYAGYNFRAYDVANHFNNYNGFDEYWGPLQATPHHMRHFWQAYMAHSPDGVEVSRGLRDPTADSEFMNQLLKWTALLAMASHLMWGFWCVVQARHSLAQQIDFLDYARIRFAAYFYLKGLHARHTFSHGAPRAKRSLA